MRKAYDERSDLLDDPLMHVLELCHIYNNKMYCYIHGLISHVDFIPFYRHLLHQGTLMSNKTNYLTYKYINPTLSLHNVYSRCTDFIPEYLRLLFTRMRLSSHRLKIETGRWARLPRERRLCVCGAAQDERHVLSFCPQVDHIRKYFEYI